MSLTTAQLTTEYTNVNEGAAPDAATQLLLAAYAQETIGGQLTDAQALSQALHSTEGLTGSAPIANTPEDSTDVALAVYQFFTGSAPTLDGLDFLVNNDGGAPLNPNDLDSAYYAGFNQANRYYNFAINLITGNPAASAAFAANYGSVTFDQAVVGAYEQIVGTPNVGSAQAATAIAAIEAQQSYFQMVAAERAPNVDQDLATKAVMIGYILEEAVKADVGYYAFAIDQFNTILAGNPEANIPGEGANGIDLLTAFPIVPPGQTFTLTPAVDTINPPAGNNNIVNGTETTFTPFDTINLGTTTGNVFNWTDTDQTDTFVTVVPTDAAVSGVQTFNIDSTTGVFADVTGFSGLQTLNADVFTWTGTTLEAGPNTAINLTYTDTSGSDDVVVIGGSVVTIEQDNPQDFSAAFITVNGGSGTTTVSITQTGESGDIRINDYYGSIANVTLTGLDDNHVTIHGDDLGLTNLTVVDAYDTAIFINGVDSTPATLNLTLNDDSIYVHDVAESYTTLNVILQTDAELTANFNGITTENISGSGVLSQNVESYFLAELESIVLSGGAGFFDEDFNVVNLPELTSIDASASSGTVTTTLNDEQTSFLGGSGTDFVIVFADATVPVIGGSAGNNEIVLNVDGGSLTAGGTYANVTNFEILGTAFNSGGTYDLGAFATPITNVDVRYDPASNLTFLNTAPVQTLSVDASLTHSVTLIQGSAAAASSHDVLDLNIGTDTSFLGVSATDGIDTSNIGSGFVNPVGTHVSVDNHPGATTTSATFTPGLANVFAHETDTLSTVLAGGTETYTLITPAGDTVTIENATNNPVTEAAAFAAAIDADPDGAIVHVTASGDQLIFTDTTVGQNWAASETVSAGEVLTFGTYHPAVVATPASGTLTVTGVDTVPNLLQLTDTAGFLGQVALTGGESAQTVADDIVTILTNDGYTASDGGGTSTTVNFTYLSVGESSMATTDTVPQVDTISLAGVSVTAGDVFQETVNGQTVMYTAVGGDTAADVAAGLAAAVNAITGTTTVTATSSGTNLFLTEIVGDATTFFTSTQVNETTFSLVFNPFGQTGSNAITANGYQTVNLDSRGLELGGHNTVYLVDNALTTLNVSGPEDLNLQTSGGHLATIDTTAASGTLGLTGAVFSEVTTGITASLGDANVFLQGNANTGSTDVITGGNGTDTIFGNSADTFLGQVTGQTGHGGNTDVTLGNGNNDVVNLYAGAHNAVSIGNGHDVLVYDHSNGADTITLGAGHDDFVLLGGSGNSSVTIGNGANAFVDTEDSTGNNIIHVGNGAGDFVGSGFGMSTVVFGTGSGDTIELRDDAGAGSGITNVTFGGQLATLDLSSVNDASFLTPTTTSQVDILTNNVSVVTGFAHGDTITLPTFDTVVTGVHNMAGVAGEAIFTTGTYSGGGGTFTEALNGHDALLTYDSGGGVFVSVVLVGGAAESVHAVNGGGDNITF